MTGGAYPMEIYQWDSQITLVRENLGSLRRIQLKRGHDAEAGLPYNGASIGRWAGDTLVADTNLTTNRIFSAGMVEFAEIGVIGGLLHLHGFQSQAPRARLNCVPIGQHDFDRRLDDNEVDVALGCTAEIPRHFAAQTLYTDRLVNVFRPENALAQRQCDLAGYLDLPHLIVSPAGHTAETLDRELAERGLQRRVELVVASYLSVPMVLANSDLVCTVPARLADQLVAFGAFEQRPIPFEHVLKVDMLWHRRNEGDLGHRWLRSVLMEAASQAGGRFEWRVSA